MKTAVKSITLMDEEKDICTECETEKEGGVCPECGAEEDIKEEGLLDEEDEE